MNLFPKNSAFSDGWNKPVSPPADEDRSTGPPPVPSKQLKVTVASKEAAVVPLRTLESWYHTLNEFVDGGRLRTASLKEASDRIEEIRDDVYSYLRG